MVVILMEPRLSGILQVVSGGGGHTRKADPLGGFLMLEYQKTKFRRSQIVSRPEGLPC